MMLRIQMAGLMLMVVIGSGTAEAYGPRGHRMVGAIADLRLGGKPVGSKITKLLDGLTLADAALLPDKIKAWEKQKADKRETVAPGHPEIENELTEFFLANPFRAKNPNKAPFSHHWFHYTDVPVIGDGLYASGPTGRNKVDIVQMIPFCIRVLKGDEPENNPKKITKTLAVILVAHFLGDIHQPLHVGAQYFDNDGKPTNPDKSGVGFETHGGLNITLILNEVSDHGRGQETAGLHHYWDENTVTTALAILRDEVLAERKGSNKVVNELDLARFLAATKPKNWSDSAAAVEKATEDWANETLAFARQAYGRLDYRDVKIDKQSNSATAVATETTKAGAESYRAWAGGVVRDGLHKGGWRLAELLERTLQ